LFFGGIVAVGIGEGENFGNFLVGFGLCGYFGVVYNYLRVEYLLVYALIKVVRDCPNEYPLGEVSNLTGRDKTIQLSGYRSRSIIAVDEFTIGGKEEGKQGRSYDTKKKKVLCAMELTDPRQSKALLRTKNN